MHGSALMPVDFDQLTLGETYDRPYLASSWGYRDWHALGRGVVTPSGQATVVLFVTKEKQKGLRQYKDYFEGELLHMEGEDNHANDGRLVNAKKNGDEVHLFYRERHHEPFMYFGKV